MDIDPKFFTHVQLRDWLKNLGQKSTGTKAELALRLSALPEEERGTAPPVEEIELETADESDNAYGRDNHDEALAAIERELTLVRRERDLLNRENEILKKQSANAASKASSAESNASADEQAIPFSIIKDMVPEFGGDSNFDFWVAQVRGIKNNYQLDENIMRALVTTKLCGKAKTWLHSSVNFAECSVEELFKQMKNVFGTQENKLLRRRRFEQRKWKPEEPFGEYYNDKIALGRNMQFEDDEMIDYLIEGIPNRQYRTQAQIQCFSDKKQLLKAFANITLNSDARINTKPLANTTEIRCYNCNAVGHYATSCTKPKRLFGACYGCGKQDHQVVNCPERKKPAMRLDHNEYRPS